LAPSGEWKAEMRDARHLREEAVVAAGRLSAALDDVSGDHRAGESVPVVSSPIEPPGRGADDERRIGDARADDDIRSRIEGFDDAPCSEVDVRRHRFDSGFGQRVAGVEMAKLVAGGLELAESREQVGALGVGAWRL